MASIEVLDKGTKKERYKVMYDVPVLPGQKRKRESKTFPHGTPKREVLQFKKKVEAAVLNYHPLANHDFTFSEVTEDYFENYTINLAANTLRGYKSIYLRETGLKNYFGNIKVKAITTSFIQSYITKLYNSGCSAKTISNSIGLVNVIMKHCTRLRYIPYNPVEGVTLPRKDKGKKIQPYTQEQVQKLLHLSKGNHLAHTVIALGTLAGLRRGEMAALTWDNVDLSDNPSITVTASKYRVSPNLGIKNPQGIKEPKTTAGIRTIPIPDLLANILRKQKLRYNTCKLQYGKNFLDSNYVLFQDNGSDYQVDSINHGYVRFMKRHEDEIPYRSLHQLRHTYASILASMNTPIKDVQELLGHSDISTTMNVYTHGFEESKRTAATELNRLICS